MRRPLWILGFLFLVACEAPTSDGTRPSPIDEASIREAVSDRVGAYVEAIKAGDLQYMRGFWADDPEFAVAGDGTLITGYDPWVASFEELVAATDSVAYVEILGDPAITVLGPDAASYAMTYRWRFEMLDGSTLSAEGSWMYVFKQSDGVWRVVHSAGTHIYS